MLLTREVEDFLIEVCQGKLEDPDIFETEMQTDLINLLDLLERDESITVIVNTEIHLGETSWPKELK